MAKKRFANINNAAIEKAHLARIENYANQVERIYQLAINEFAQIGSSIPNIITDKLFSFKDYPFTSDKVNQLLKKTYSGILGTIKKGNELEWLAAAEKNDKFVKEVFKSSKLTKSQLKKYNDRNLEGLKAFQQRKDAGMNLSDRIWNYTKSFKAEIELGLDEGLGKGKSAAVLSQVLRSNLKEPDKLFRRIRDKRGSLVLSKAAQQFSPGTGVYRSSYKNAMRLTRTETNMAYRASDHARWQQLDFVVGIEIRLSNNPNHCPTCAALAGKYPKNFKFMGWHPQCRCHAISILKTDEEIDADDIRILQGKEVITDSENTVSDIPQGLKKWIDENKERAAQAKSTPYWIRDNFKDGDLGKGLKFETTSKQPDKKKPVVETPKFKPYAILNYEKELGIKVDDNIFRLLKMETPLTHDDKSGAYFLPDRNMINIPFDEARRRSKWKAESVVYHEYGHAADWQHGIKEMPEVKNLMDKYRKTFKANVNEGYKKADKELFNIGYKSYKDGEFDTMHKTVAAHDTLMSLNKKFGTGHNTKVNFQGKVIDYFDVPGNKEAEFIAHMFENKFIGNEVFKQVMPELYDDMIELMDQIIEKISQ